MSFSIDLQHIFWNQGVSLDLELIVLGRLAVQWVRSHLISISPVLGWDVQCSWLCINTRNWIQVLVSVRQALYRLSHFSSFWDFQTLVICTHCLAILFCLRLLFCKVESHQDLIFPPPKHPFSVESMSKGSKGCVNSQIVVDPRNTTCLPVYTHLWER